MDEDLQRAFMDQVGKPQMVCGVLLIMESWSFTARKDGDGKGEIVARFETTEATEPATDPATNEP